MRVDKRKHYYLVVDTETCKFDTDSDIVCGTNSLVYDIGVAIIDKRGQVYETLNLVVDEIFHGEYLRMRICYYANKLPQYYIEIGAGIRKVVPFKKARKMVLDLMTKYNTKDVVAYNTSFDYYALNKTNSYLCDYWNFFPKDTTYIDAMKMAKQYFKGHNKYTKFCYDNQFLTQKGYPQMKAETVYRYITKDIEFIEKHTGLEDVLIESQIFAWLYSKVKSEFRTIEFKY